MNRSIALLATASLATASLWALHRRGDDAPAAVEPARLATDRLWIDHLPRNDRDTFQSFALIGKLAHGMFQQSSAWTGAYEIFGYELHGGELRMTFPQTGQRDTAPIRARRCKEQGMDFCLEIDGASHGVKKYYSREGWEITAATTDAVPQQIKQLLQASK